MSTDRSDEKEQERFWNEFRVGVLAVAALALLVLGVRFLQGTSLFGNTYTLTAHFEQAEGVASGTPVTVRGISVGTVDRIALADDAGVRVRMSIQDGVQLREGTTASVGGIAALDDVSISLNRADEGEPLADGAQIPTVQQGTLGKLQDRALPIAERIDSVLVQTSGTLSEAQRVLAGSEPNLQRMTKNLRSASAGISAFVQQERAPMRRAIGHLENTAATLEALVDTLDRDTLAQAVQDAERTMHYTRRTAQSLEQSAEDLEAILADLRAGRGTAGKLLDDPRLYHRADSLSLRMDRILKDFEENPGRYISLEIF